MILTVLGLLISFVGAFAIILETISGSSIRPKIYQFVLQGVYEPTLNGSIRKIKLTNKELRVLIWIALIVVGFLIQVFDLIPKEFWINLISK